MQVDETDLPTQKEKEKTFARIPDSNADQIWAECDQAQARKREKGAHSLRWAGFFVAREDHGCVAWLMGIITIKKNRDYRQVFTRGRYRSDRLLVLYRMANGTGGRRFGITVSRKLGGAVVRNRVRRRLKEICRLNPEAFPSGYDYVIVARPPAAECDHRVLTDSLLQLVGNIKNE